MKKFIVSFILLLACLPESRSQNYILEYAMDFNFANSNIRFYLDRMRITTTGGNVFHIPSQGLLLYQAQGVHTVTGALYLPVNVAHTYDIPCPVYPIDPVNPVEPVDPPPAVIGDPDPGLTPIELPVPDPGIIAAPAREVNYGDLSGMLTQMNLLYPVSDPIDTRILDSIPFPTCTATSYTYSGPVKSLEFLGLARQSYSWGFWNTACGSTNSVPYLTAVEQHSFDLTGMPHSFFNCLYFGDNTISIRYFRLRPDVRVSVSGYNLELHQPTTFWATSGFPAGVYRWEYGLKNASGGTDWYLFPNEYQGKSSFSATGFNILKDRFLPYKQQGKPIYIRLNYNPLTSEVFTLNPIVPELDPGTIKATSALNMLKGVLPGKLESTAPATGGTGDYTYYWEAAPVNALGTFNYTTVQGNIPGAYQPGTLTQSTVFRRKVCDGDTCKTTPVVIFTVYDDLLPGRIAAESDSPVLSGTAPGFMIAGTAPASGGCGNYSYCWQQSTDGGLSWESVPAGQIYYLGSYWPGELTTTTWFRREVSSGAPKVLFTACTDPVCIRVVPPVEILDHSKDYRKLYKDAADTLRLMVAGGDGSYSYNWERSFNRQSWFPVSTEAAYPLPTDSSGVFYYRCKVSSMGSQAVSGEMEVVVLDYHKEGWIIYNQQIIEGRKPAVFRNIEDADPEYCPDPCYFWEYAQEAGHWLPVEGAEEADYHSGALYTTTWFRRGVMCEQERLYSNELSVEVYPHLKAVKGLNNNPLLWGLPLQQVLAGTAPSPVYAGATGGNGAYHYQWQQRRPADTSGPWLPASGTNHAAAYTPPALQDTMMYRCRINNLGDTVYSDTVFMLVYSRLRAGTIGGDQELSFGQVPALLSNAGYPAGGVCPYYRYQWQDSTVYGRWRTIDDSDSPDYQPGALSRTTWFRRVVQLTCEGGFTASEISNEVCLRLSGRIEADQLISRGGLLKPLTGTDPVAQLPPAYQWQDSTAGRWKNIVGATQATYLPPYINGWPGVYYFRRLLQFPDTLLYSNVVTITVKDGPVSLDYYPTAGNYPVNYTVVCAPLTAVRHVADLSLAQQQQASVINYSDGLGRPIATVLPLHTPEGRDLVEWSSYDAQGREYRKYLPYPRIPTGGGMAGGYIPEPEAVAAQQQFYGAGEQRPFSETRYESSPLGRVVQQWGPGNAWATRPVGYNYRTNGQTLGGWKAAADGSYLPVSYLPGTLLITELTSEDGHTSSVYKDKEGKVVIEEAEDLQTRYVYDDFGRKHTVIPPGIAGPDENNCFGYRYDERGRVIAEKTPGAGWVYAIYDAYNRKVMTQDANQQESMAWSRQSYDRLNRPVLTEELYFSLPYTREAMQQLYDNTALLPHSHSNLLSETRYDDYPADSLAFVPDDLAQEPQLAAVNRGRVTMSRSRVLLPVNGIGTPERFLATASYYDSRGRVIQTVAENILGGADRISTAYLFSGTVAKTLQRSSWENGYGVMEHLSLLTEYSYDAQERLKSVRFTINSQQPVVLSAMEYDELLRLKKKTLHGGAEVINYVYNIRNQCTRISANHFSETLYYEQALSEEAQPQYGGNISAMEWRTARQGDQGYLFSYDAHARLTGSRFFTRAQGSLQPPADRYSEQLGYDAQGRILWLRRTDAHSLIDSLAYSYSGVRLQEVNDGATEGGLPSGLTQYRYDANGNITFEGNRVRIAYNLLNLPKQLQLLGGRSLKVTYSSDGRKLITEARKSNNELEDYRSYSGNLIFDANDDLSAILTPEGRIVHYPAMEEYRYEYHLKDHLGSVRVAFTVASSGEVAIVQENAYYLFGALISELSYQDRPFSENLYRYTGHESVRSFGLPWYDCGARYYNPLLGVFMAVDPQAHRGYKQFPYAYCGNNPISNIDPDGEFFFSFLGPIGVIIDGMCWGAVIGAGTSAVAYGIGTAITGQGSWNNFCNAVGMGAVGGALGGGFGALGSTGVLGSFWNALGYNMLSHAFSGALTNTAFGNDLTLGGIAGMAAGGLLGSVLPNFNGVSGGAFKNAMAEIGFNSGRGALTGFASGLIQAGVDENLDAIWQNTLGGIISGASTSILNIAAMGATYVPNQKYESFQNGEPVYRRGTFLFPKSTGVTIGRNLVTRLTGDQTYDSFLQAHETGHYYQQLKLGFANFYGRVAKEYLSGFNSGYDTGGMLDFGANIYSLRQIGYFWSNKYGTYINNSNYGKYYPDVSQTIY